MYFSDNGATAVEAALKIAFQYRLLTRARRRAEAVYISLDNAYHGDTLGAAAVGGVELFHDIFKPILLPSLKTPSPYAIDVRSARRRENVRSIAPTSWSRRSHAGRPSVCGDYRARRAGRRRHVTLPDGFLSRAAEACRTHGALLILDEVATGFGRTGRCSRASARA